MRGYVQIKRVQTTYLILLFYILSVPEVHLFISHQHSQEAEWYLRDSSLWQSQVVIC